MNARFSLREQRDTASSSVRLVQPETLKTRLSAMERFAEPLFNRGWRRSMKTLKGTGAKVLYLDFDGVLHHEDV